MEYEYISSIELNGIHKRYNLKMDFNKSLNILFGQNGTGKSTLIHVLANIANCDFIRFAFLNFDRINLKYSNGKDLEILQYEQSSEIYIRIKTKESEDLLFTKREALEALRDSEEETRFLLDYTPELNTRIKLFIEQNGLKVVGTSYFPAFRTMLEAWSSSRVRSSSVRVRDNRKRKVTMFSRELFGDFLPSINYPSPLEIENALKEEIRQCQLRIARYESSIFSDSFVRVFSALLRGKTADSNPEDLLREISKLTNESSAKNLAELENGPNTYRQLQGLVEEVSQSDLKSSASGALEVYRDALKDRQNFKQLSFNEIDKYFEVLNSFLDNKEISYELNKGKNIRVGLKFGDGTWSPIKVMSSGERQLLTMLYAVNKMSGNSTVLIDEPELSLHIDWQEDLLAKMMEQLGERQIIVCTHSPSIAAGFDEYMKEVNPDFIDRAGRGEELTVEEEEDF